MYRLEMVGVQEVIWGKGVNKLADDYVLFYGNVNANYRRVYYRYDVCNTKRRMA